MCVWTPLLVSTSFSDGFPHAHPNTSQIDMYRRRVAVERRRVRVVAAERRRVRVATTSTAERRRRAESIFFASSAI